MMKLLQITTALCIQYAVKLPKMRAGISMKFIRLCNAAERKQKSRTNVFKKIKNL